MRRNKRILSQKTIVFYLVLAIVLIFSAIAYQSFSSNDIFEFKINYVNNLKAPYSVIYGFENKVNQELNYEIEIYHVRSGEQIYFNSFSCLPGNCENKIEFGRVLLGDYELYINVFYLDEVYTKTYSFSLDNLKNDFEIDFPSEYFYDGLGEFEFEPKIKSFSPEQRDFAFVIFPKGDAKSSREFVYHCEDVCNPKFEFEGQVFFTEYEVDIYSNTQTQKKSFRITYVQNSSLVHGAGEGVGGSDLVSEEEVSKFEDFVVVDERKIENEYEDLNNNLSYVLKTKVDSEIIDEGAKIENLSETSVSNLQSPISSLSLESLSEGLGVVLNESQVVYELEVSGQTSIKSIVFENLSLNESSNFELGLSEFEPNLSSSQVSAFAIDPTRLEFDKAYVTVVAKGTSLYKCSLWNFSSSLCLGDWVLYKGGLVPGQEYVFEIDGVDPGFVEIISINKADLLDSNRLFLEDVYDKVSVPDNVTSILSSGQFLRVTFEKPLFNGGDIKVIGSSVGSSQVRIYEKDSSVLLGEIFGIGLYGEYKYVFVNLSYPIQTFDLEFLGDDVFVDYVVDPLNVSNVTLNSTSVQNLTSDDLVLNYTLDSATGALVQWYLNGLPTLILDYQFIFNHTSSNITKDYSVSGADATVNGAEWFSANSGYYNFDGTDTITDSFYEPQTSSQPFSITAWIRISNASQTGSRAIASWGHNDHGKHMYFGVGSGETGTNPGRLHFGNLRDGEYSVRGSTDLRDGNWHLVAAVKPAGVNSTNGTLLFVDGALDVAYSGNLGTLSDIDSLNNPLMIGKKHFAAWNGDWGFFNGDIAEVREYSIELTTGFLDEQYNSQINRISGKQIFATQNWSARVAAYNSTNITNWVFSNNVTIVDIPQGEAEPNTVSMIFNSTLGQNLSTEDLFCYGNFTDDVVNNVTVYYRWLKNGVVNKTGSVANVSVNVTILITTLNNSETTANETWSCSLRANDWAQNETDWNTRSMFIRSGIPPVVSNVTLNATSPYNYTTDNLTLYFNTSDLDLDSVTVNTIWYYLRNGIKYKLYDSLSGEILYHAFDVNASSTFSPDSSVSKDNAVCSNTFYFVAGGIFEGGMEFEGSNDICTLAFDLPADTTRTISFWTKFPLTSSAGGWRTGFRGRDTTEMGDHHVMVDSNGLLGIYNNNGPGWLGCSPAVDTDNYNGWVHIVAISNGANTFYYLNGTNVCNVTGVANSVITYIGNYPASNQEWGGIMDDLRVFDRNISVAEVTRLYNRDFEIFNWTVIPSKYLNVSDIWWANLTPFDGGMNGTSVLSNNITIRDIPESYNSSVVSDMVLNLTDNPLNTTNGNLTCYGSFTDSGSLFNMSFYMPFEVDNVTALTDFSGNNNNGVVYGNSLWYNSNGYDGKGAYYFDGSGDRISVARSSVLELTNALSLSIWFKRNSTQNTWAKIVWYGNNSVAPWGVYGFEFNNTDDDIVRFKITNSSIEDVVLSGTILDNTWYHLVGTYDGSQIKFYVDGVLVGNKSHSGAIAPYSSNVGLGIGDKYETGQGFRGYVDDVRLYNFTLNADEVLRIYNDRPKTYYNWYVNGTYQAGLSGYISGMPLNGIQLISIVNSSYTSTADLWICSIMGFDGYSNGSYLNKSIFILGADPIVQNVTLNATDSPQNLTTANLTLWFDTYDADGQNVSALIEWYRNGVLYTSGGTVLDLEFESGSNSTFTPDSSGFNRNGNVSGATWNSVGSRDGSGYYKFDGVNDYIDVGSVGISGSVSRTISVWVKADSTTQSGYAGVFGFSPTGGGNGNWFDIEVNGGNYIIHNYGTDYNIRAVDLNWHHLVVTYDGTTERRYSDGALIGSANIGLNTIDEVEVGRRPSMGSYFNGQIDSPMIYKYALNATEISTLYSKGFYFRNISTIDSSVTQAGENWSARVRPFDGLQWGQWNWSNNITINPELFLSFVTPLNNSFANSNIIGFDANITNYDSTVNWCRNVYNSSFNGVRIQYPQDIVNGTNKYLDILPNGNWSVRLVCNRLGLNYSSSVYNLNVTGVPFVLNATSLGNYTEDNLSVNYTIYNSVGINPYVNWRRNNQSYDSYLKWLPTNQLRYWITFDNFSNDFIEDKSSYMTTTVASGTINWANDSVKGGVYYSDGSTNDAVVAPSYYQSQSSAQPLVVSAWIKQTNTAGWTTITSWGDDDDGNRMFYFTSTGNVYVGDRDTYSGNSIKINDSLWHHVLIRKYASCNLVSCLQTYVDGFMSNWMLTGNDDLNPFNFADTPVTIGKDSEQDWNRWIGYLDNVMFIHNDSVSLVDDLYKNHVLLIEQNETLSGEKWSACFRPYFNYDGFVTGGICANELNITNGMQIDLLSPLNNTFSNSSVISFNFNISQGYDGSVKNCSLVVDNVLTNYSELTPLRTDMIVGTLAPGIHNWSIRCFRNLGFYAESLSYNISVSSSLPIMINASSVYNLTSDNLTVWYNILGLDSNNVSTQLYLNNRTFSSIVNGANVSDLLLLMNFENYTSNADRLRDYSSYKQNVTTLLNSPAISAVGFRPNSSSYYFDGTNDAIDVGDINELDSPTKFSFALNFNRDVNRNDPSYNGVDNVIFSQSDDWFSDNIEVGSSDFDLEIWMRTAGWTGLVTIPAGILDDRWYNLVVTYDSSWANELQVYLDGVLVYSTNVYGGALNNKGTGHLVFGGTNMQHLGDAEFQGYLDDVQVYNISFNSTLASAFSLQKQRYVPSTMLQASSVWRAEMNLSGTNYVSNNLTVYDVIGGTFSPVVSFVNLTASDYPQNLTTANLRCYANISDDHFMGQGMGLYLPFDNSSALSLVDYADSNSVSATGGPTWNSNGGIDNLSYYRFDGVNDYLRVLDSPTVEVQNNQFSVSVWVNGTFDHSAVEGMVIEKGSWATTGEYAITFFNKNAPRFQLWGGAPDMFCDAITNVNDGVWHNIVGTWDGQYMRIYVDGVLENTTSNTFSFTQDAEDLFIGSRLGTSLFFNGAIDDVRVYNRTLSAGEVLDIATRKRGDVLKAVYKWYLNGTEQTSLGGNFSVVPGVLTEVSVLGNGITGIDEIWTCSVTGYDGKQTSQKAGNFSLNSSVWVINEPPIVSNVVLNSSTIFNYSVHNLTLWYNVTEPNGDVYNISTRWFRNGVELYPWIPWTVNRNQVILDMLFEDGAISACNGCVANDSSYYLNNGTLTRGPDWYMDSPFAGFYDYGSYRFFRESLQELRHPNSVSFNSISTAVTISVWVKPVSYAWYPGIFSRDSDRLTLRLEGNTGRIQFRACRNSGNWITTDNIAAEKVALNQWNHVVATYDELTGLQRIYLNGTLVQEGTIFCALDHSGFTPVIGSRDDDNPGGVDDYFDGQIADVQVYNFSMNSSTVTKLYQRESYNTTVMDEFYVIDGDVWRAAIRACDKYSCSDWTFSNNISINRSPLPGIIVYSPVNNSNIFGIRDVNFTYTFVDNESLNLSYMMYIDGVLNISSTMINNTNISLFYTNMTPGRHNWTLFVRDGDNDWINETYYFVILNRVHARITKIFKSLASDVFGVELNVTNLLNDSSSNLTVIDFIDSSFNYIAFTPIPDWSDPIAGFRTGATYGWNYDLNPNNDSRRMNYTIVRYGTQPVLNNYIFALD